MSLEPAADVFARLEAHHQARTHQRVEDSVTLSLIQPADFHRSSHADFVAGYHAKQQLLELVETCVYHERVPHTLSPLPSRRASDVPLGLMPLYGISGRPRVRIHDGVGKIYRVGTELSLERGDATRASGGRRGWRAESRERARRARGCRR